ncbi:RIP metalloprotease RseP [Candidatus Azambacteria bacterium]|nr:RIP metalloprotease RseP [Candidatus Azambacteria bacterium]
MAVVLSVVVFLIILALLVLVHEFGHFKAARKFGIRVDEFGFGFPPKIWGKKKGETEYSVNWIPLGGFVKIFGESREGAGDPASFVSKPVWQRMIVILAGVVMNWVLAVALLTVGFWYGLPQLVTDDNISRARDITVAITEIAPKSPAEEAGFKVGDTLKSVEFKEEKVEISEPWQVQEFIAAHKGEKISIELKRGGKTLNVDVTPRVDVPKGEGAVGIAMGKIGIVSSVWYKAPIDGFESAWRTTGAMLSGFYDILKNLIVTGKAGVEVAGPIGIGQMTYQFTQLGFSYLIQFAAILSINLAILNALPIPALDGGRFLFLVIEAIKRSPVSERVEMAFQTAGIVLLIMLMVLVTIKDIIRLL